MIWAGVDLRKPIVLFDPEQAGRVTPQRGPRADAVRVPDLMETPRRGAGFHRPEGTGYDWQAESRGSGRPLNFGG